MIVKIQITDLAS